MADTDILKRLRSRAADARAKVEDLEHRLETERENLSRIETAIAVVTEELPEVQKETAVVSGGPDGPTEEELRARLAEPDTPIKDKAIEVLRFAGVTLKNRQVADRLLKYGMEYEGDVNRLRNTIGVVLNRAAGDPDSGVKKVAAGTYAVEGVPTKEGAELDLR